MTKRRCRTFSLLRMGLSICSGLIVLQPVFCAQYDAQKVKEQQKKHMELTRDYHTMTTPVDFPDLPAYSGRSKFVMGYLSPSANGISACHMQFLAEEDPQTVISFYKSALTGNKWKINYDSPTSICARHAKGHMCNINVSESHIPKTKSRYVIDYRQVESQQH